MVEIVLSICLALGFVGLLVYLYFHEKSEREYIKKIQSDLHSLPTEMQKFYMEISKETTTQTHKTLGESFKNFLKHIEKLERMTLPQPVTTKAVQSVLDRVGEIAENKAENEIESAEKGVELPNNEWTGMISPTTKVAFEEDIPVIEE